MPKVLLPIGDATETLDTFYPVFRLQEDGFECVVAGPEARWYHTVMHEIPPDATIPWALTLRDKGHLSPCLTCSHPSTIVYTTMHCTNSYLYLRIAPVNG